MNTRALQVDAKHSMQGFTLLELLMAIVIVSILVGIALPSYTEFVKKGRRADGMAALLDVANRQEQFLLDRNTYTVTVTDLGLPTTSADGHYTITVAAPTAACPINRCYALTATPASGSPQEQDTKCTSFRLTSAGLKTATGEDAAECWSR